MDSSGSLFIADTSNSRIRKVDTSGNICTVAGNGTQGFSGDGGPATSALLNRPVDVAVDSSGNLFIADQFNHRIRKVDTSGNISTVAGNGTEGFSGDGGPATSALLNRPVDVAVDSSGNLFIADRLNHHIRKVDTSGNISTVAGTGTAGLTGDGGPATGAQLNSPRSVAFDSSGNLFIADTFNYRIRKVDTSGNITTVAGNGTKGDLGDGGPATSAQLDGPSDVAVDTSGNLFIADTFNYRIRKVEALGSQAGTTPASTPPPIGGIVSFFDDSGARIDTADGPSSPLGLIAALGSSAVVALATLATGGWYVRRHWFRNRS